MPYCQNCGHPFSVGATFCENCIARLNVHVNTNGNQQRERANKSIQDVERECSYCKGSGKIKDQFIFWGIQCPVCNGKCTNLVPAEWVKCPTCGGTGSKFFASGIGNGKVRRPDPNCWGKGWTRY